MYPMFIAALFTSQNMKNLSIHCWINGKIIVYIQQNIIQPLKNEIVLSAIIPLVNLVGIMISEKSQRKTNTI